MSEKNEIITTENLQTVVVVCFILSLLSIAFNFYNFSRVNASIVGTHAAHYAGQKTDLALVERINRLASVEGRVEELEKRLAAMEAAAAPPAPTPAPE